MPSRKLITVGLIAGLVAVAATLATITLESRSSGASVDVDWDTIQTYQSNSSAWVVEIQNTGTVPVVGISLVRVDVIVGNQVTDTFRGLIGEGQDGATPNPFVLETGTTPCCFYGTLITPQTTGRTVSPTTPMQPGHLAFTELAWSTQSALAFFQACAPKANSNAAVKCTAVIQVTYSDNSISTIMSPINVSSL